MKKHSSFFWTSYSDLMTSLFFVMLVLFILTIGVLVRQVRATQDQLAKIREIEHAVKELPEEFFDYNEGLKKHILRLNVEFGIRESVIKNESVLSDLEEVGKEITKIVTKFNERDDLNVQYLVIVEGQASRIPYDRNECENNDVLSYQRALTLKKFWESKGIFLDKIPNCEFLIAGSGEGGVPRDLPDDERSTTNQRFLIHIIPKPGVID